MPSPRRDRETNPAAVSWSLETRPADATPDYGDRCMPGYVPGVTGKRHEARRKAGKPRSRRNGLPDQVFYITDQVREYYAAQGITLPGARAYFGAGRDIYEES
jgi:hypothetical protein